MRSWQPWFRHRVDARRSGPTFIESTTIDVTAFRRDARTYYALYTEETGEKVAEGELSGEPIGNGKTFSLPTFTVQLD